MLREESVDRTCARDRPVGSLLTFFVLTYVVTWICFGAAVALSGRFGPPASGLSNLGAPLLFLGSFGPALAAIGLTAWEQGTSATQALLARMFQSGVAARWYVFAAGYMAAVKLAVTIVHRLMIGAWPRFTEEPWYVIAVVILTATPVTAGEEIGWRGYALPRLAARFGLARGSLLLGLIGACWHLPLFLLPGYTNPSFPMFVPLVMAASVAAAWLYACTNGSLLLTMLLHSAWNQTGSIVPAPVSHGHPLSLDTSPVTLLTLGFLWMCSAYFLVRMRRMDLPR